MAMNGLEKITEKIVAEANLEAERIFAEAQEQCNRISADYLARTDAMLERLSEEAEREATDMISRAKADAATKRRNALLAVQSSLIDEAFESVYAEIKNWKADKYTDLMIGLLCGALSEQADAERTSRTLYGEEDAMAPAQYELLFNANDRARFGQAILENSQKRMAGKLSPQLLKKLVLSEKTLPIDGGFVLRCGDIEVNCSLDMIFLQLREELEGDVSRALLGTSDHI